MSKFAGTDRGKLKTFFGLTFGKFLIPTVFVVSLLLVPVIFFFLSKFSQPVQSWFDAAWEFRTPISLTYSGTELTNYDVLVEVDTATLIAASKIQTDCDDIRFVDSNDTTQLAHWIETGCNTSNTQIWVRVPSLPDAGKTIYMYYGSGLAVNAEATWSGNINLFSTTSCPAGWTRNTDADGKFLFGSSSYGGVGGGDAHEHSEASCATDLVSGSAGLGSVAGVDTGFSTSHTHSNLGTSISNATNILPPYIDSILCSSPDFEAKAGLAALFKDLPSSGWTNESEYNDLFVRSSSTFGGTGGSATHTHNFTGGVVTDSPVGSVSTSVEDFGTGADGAVTIASNKNINTSVIASGRSYADGVVYPVSAIGSSSVTVSSAPNGIASGDEVLLINLQGNASYYANVGNYELKYVSSVAGNTITFSSAVTKIYGATSSNATLTGQRIVVQRVPQYTNVTVNAGVTLYANPFDGVSGGIVAFKASGTVTVNGVITSSSRGYRGGANTGYQITLAGESFCGYNTGNGAYGDAYNGNCGGGGGGGWYGSKLPGTGGIGGAGGGGGSVPGGEETSFGAGGGGGGYGSGYGVNISSPGTSGGGNKVNQRGGNGGLGGTYGVANLSKLFFGSGGGAGGLAQGTAFSYSGAGGTGGGIVFIAGNTINVGGSITSAGAGGGTGGALDPTRYGGGGGGGAGGSVLLVAGSGSIGTSTVSALNGAAGYAIVYPGLAGGVGRIAIKKGVVSGTTNPAYTTISQSSGSYTASHTHTSLSGVTNSASNVPPYLKMIFASADLVEEYEPGTIAIFDQLPPLGWEIETSLNGRFPMGSSTYGEVGGSSNHTHGLTVTTGEPSSSVSGLFTGTSQSLAGTLHTHSCSTTTNEASSLPPYMEVIYGRKKDNSLDGVVLAVQNEESNSPATPSSVAAQGLSTSSIRWNFVDNSMNEIGFRVLDTLDNIKVVCEQEDISYCDETGLSINTEYTRKFLAYNSNGDSQPSLETSRYTLTSVPLLSIDSVSINQISLIATGSVNLAHGNSGLYFDCTSSNCDTGINVWTQETTTTVTGLEPNTSYTFQVKARNGDGVETVYSTPVSIYTLAEIPTLAINAVYYSGFDLEITNANNLDAGQSGVYFQCLSYGCDVPSAGINEWVNISTDNASQLGINTYYEFNAKARNGDGVETDYSDTVGAYTAARTPYAPVLTPISDTSVNVVISLFPNSPQILLAALEETTGKYYNPSTGQLQDTEAWATWYGFGQTSGKPLEGLTPGTNYSIKFKAKNTDDLETSFGSAASVYTNLTSPVIATPTVLSETSIRWNFTDESTNEIGVKIYDTQDNLVSDCSTEDITFCDETGLAPNTSYTRVAVAYNANATSAVSSSASAFTFANLPSFNSVNIDTDSAVFDISMGQNPVSTEILIQDEASGQYVDMSNGTLTNFAYWGSYSDFGQTTSYELSGLSLDTLYQFKIKARNTDNVETAFSSVTNVYTLSASPQIVLSAESNTAVKIVIDEQANPSTTEYAIYNDDASQYVNSTDGSLQAGEDWALYSTFGGAAGIVVPNLSANTQYTFSIKSRNGDAVETVLSGLQSVFTLVNSPSVSSLTANSANVIVAVIDPALNTSATEFALYESITGNFVNSSLGSLQAGEDWANYVGFGEGSGLGVVGLSPNTMYQLSVKARNGDLVESGLSSGVQKYTLANTPGVPDVTNESLSSLRIVLNTNGNPAITEFALQEQGSGTYVNPATGLLEGSEVWGTYNDYGNSSGVIVTNLETGTEYIFVAKARNGDQVETTYSSSTAGATSLNAPTILAPEVLNSTTIRWNFTDTEANEEGFKIFDENGIQKAQCVGADLTYCDEYGLSPNVEYTRKAAAYNATGVGEFSGTESVYTEANIPASLTVMTLGSTLLNVAFADNSNPSQTRYLIQEVVSGNYVNFSTGRLQSTESWGTYAEFGSNAGRNAIELFANALYSFKVKARNEDGVSTLYTSEVEAYTSAVKPGNPYATADSSTSITLQLNSGGNPPFTEFSVKEISGGKYLDASSGSLKAAEYWGTYANYGRAVGVKITGLSPNSKYTFEVTSRNGDGVVTLEKGSVQVYTLANVPNAPVIRNAGNISLEIGMGAIQNPVGTEYTIYEERVGRYLNVVTSSLTTKADWRKSNQLSNVILGGLTPGASYRFSIKARNGDGVETILSTGISVVMRASIPSVREGSAITTEAIRVLINTNNNDSSVQYLIYDETNGMYIDKASGAFIESESWGTYTEFGGGNGFVVDGLTPASDYAFRISARNSEGVVTGLGGRSIVGTNAILINIPEGIQTRLKNNLNLDPSSDAGSQRGEQRVRFNKGALLVADVPILFDRNRDVSEIVVDSDPDTNRAVVKAGKFRGTETKFTMYVVKGDTNRFRLCPKAENIGEVETTCPGGILFVGPFPQTIGINSSDISVSVAIIEGVEYWVIDGLSGTGGLGEYSEEKKPVSVVEEPTVTVEEEKQMSDEPIVIIDQVFNQVNSVVENTPKAAQQVVDGVVDVLDKTVGTLPESQATAVTSVATATTVTIGLAAVSGGIGSLPYYIMQIIMGILSFFGFRKRGKPYGYVYDSVTKAPISRAVVRIYNTKDVLVWTDVTDRFGAFNAELGKGKFKMVVKKLGYTFPSVIVIGLSDSPLEPIYHGQEFSSSNNKQVDLIVPMDPTNSTRLLKMSVGARSRIEFAAGQLHLLVFIVGLILAIYTYNKYPNGINVAILVVYIPSLFVVARRVFSPKKGYAKVKTKNGQPVSGVEVGLQELEFDRYVGKRVTDANGMYRFLAPKGVYRLELLSKDYKVVKFAGGSGVVEVREEGGVVVAKEITVKKK